MNKETYLTTLLTLVLIGSRCGIACSPSIGFVLSSNVLTYAKNIRNAFVSYLAFYTGKLLSVTALCMAVHIAGEAVIRIAEQAGSDHVNLILKAALVIAGLYYMLTAFRKDSHCTGSCAACAPSCTDTKLISPFCIGMAYGITPCAPLLLLLTESLAMTISQKLLASVIFTAANAVSPVILLIIITVLASGRADLQKTDARPVMKLLSGIIMIVSGLTLRAL